ncbi:hypothetical protein LPJ76_000531 [Coemansia sp. RSA 638]|nr:hypothetical protein LPJ76_000531 [Coemansia sp. RSA 638]
MKAIILSGDYIEDYELFAPIKLPEMLDIDVHVILAAAGVLKGRSCSAVHISKLEVLAGGGTYVDFDMLSKNVYVDGNLVSAPAYPVIGVWMREFIKLLGVKVQFSS